MFPSIARTIRTRPQTAVTLTAQLTGAAGAAALLHHTSIPKAPVKMAEAAGDASAKTAFSPNVRANTWTKSSPVSHNSERKVLQ